MWWCECKAATRRGASSGYSWPHHWPVVEGRCFYQVSINWRDVARHIGFPWSQHLLLPHILKYLPTSHYYPLDLTGAIQAHWSGEALECRAVMVHLSALIKNGHFGGDSYTYFFAEAGGGRGRVPVAVPLMRQLSLIGASSVCAGVLSCGLSTSFSSLNTFIGLGRCRSEEWLQTFVLIG